MAKKTKRPAPRNKAGKLVPRPEHKTLPAWTPLPPAQGLPKAPQLEPSRVLLPENKF